MCNSMAAAFPALWTLPEATTAAGAATDCGSSRRMSTGIVDLVLQGYQQVPVAGPSQAARNSFVAALDALLQHTESEVGGMAMTKEQEQEQLVPSMLMKSSSPIPPNPDDPAPMPVPVWPRLSLPKLFEAPAPSYHTIPSASTSTCHTSTSTSTSTTHAVRGFFPGCGAGSMALGTVAIATRSGVARGCNSTQPDAKTTAGSPSSGKRSRGKRELKHKCSFCSKMFLTPYKKQRHERVHTGAKPFCCTLCPLAFSQKCALKSHSRLHAQKITGVRRHRERGGTRAMTRTTHDALASAPLLINGYLTADLLAARESSPSPSPTVSPQSATPVPLSFAM